mgnify:CR=1 FL=1
MKLKYLVSVVLIVPLLALFLVNIVMTGLSSFQVSAINFVCLAIIFIGLVDMLFILFKHHKLKLKKP